MSRGGNVDGDDASVWVLLQPCTGRARQQALNIKSHYAIIASVGAGALELNELVDTALMPSDCLATIHVRNRQFVTLQAFASEVSVVPHQAAIALEARESHVRESGTLHVPPTTARDSFVVCLRPDDEIKLADTGSISISIPRSTTTAGQRHRVQVGSSLPEEESFSQPHHQNSAFTTSINTNALYSSVAAEESFPRLGRSASSNSIKVNSSNSPHKRLQNKTPPPQPGRTGTKVVHETPTTAERYRDALQYQVVADKAQDSFQNPDTVHAKTMDTIHETTVLSQTLDLDADQIREATNIDIDHASSVIAPDPIVDREVNEVDITGVSSSSLAYRNQSQASVHTTVVREDASFLPLQVDQIIGPAEIATIYDDAPASANDVSGKNVEAEKTSGMEMPDVEPKNVSSSPQDDDNKTTHQNQDSTPVLEKRKRGRPKKGTESPANAKKQKLIDTAPDSPRSLRSSLSKNIDATPLPSDDQMTPKSAAVAEAATITPSIEVEIGSGVQKTPRSRGRPRKSASATTPLNHKTAVTGSTPGATKQAQSGSSQTRSTTSNWRIVFSGSTIPERPATMKFLQQQGAKKVEKISSTGATFDIVAVGGGEIRKTSKVLMAVALGKPVVKDAWLTESVNVGKLLPIEDHFAAGISARTLSRKTLLEGKTLFITPGLKKDYKSGYKEVEDLAHALGAATTISRPARDISRVEATELLILAMEHGDIDAASLSEHGFKCYGKDALSDGVLKGQLDLEQYIIRFSSSQGGATTGKKGRGRPKKS